MFASIAVCEMRKNKQSYSNYQARSHQNTYESLLVIVDLVVENFVMGMHGNLAVDKRIHSLLALFKELTVQLIELLHESLGSGLVHVHALRILSLRRGLRSVLGLSHLHLRVLSTSNMLGAPGLLGLTAHLSGRIHQDRRTGVRHGLQQRVIASPLLDRVSLQLHSLIIKVG